MLDKHTAHVVLMYVSWVEFVLGGKMTDSLGTDNPLDNKNLSKNLNKFEELLKTKNIDNIKPEEVWGKN